MVQRLGGLLPAESQPLAELDRRAVVAATDDAEVHGEDGEWKMKAEGRWFSGRPWPPLRTAGGAAPRGRPCCGPHEQPHAQGNRQEDEAGQRQVGDPAAAAGRPVDGPQHGRRQQPGEHGQRGQHQRVVPRQHGLVVAVVDHIQQDARQHPHAHHQHGEDDRPAVGPLEPFQAGQPQRSEQSPLALQPPHLAEVHHPAGKAQQHRHGGQQDRHRMDARPRPARPARRAAAAGRRTSGPWRSVPAPAAGGRSRNAAWGETRSGRGRPGPGAQAASRYQS